MTERHPFASVTPDDLRSLAREAASEHMSLGTNLTDAVVKAASMYDAPLTSEHVRRVCEMTYHDVFERKFREAGGTDRYISFDPPDAAEASSRLRSEKVASVQVQERNRPMTNSLIEKVAHVAGVARRTRVNAFDEITKQADGAPVSWYNPLGEVCYVKDRLREARNELQTRLSTLEGSEKFAMMELTAQAYQAYKQGTAVAGILHSCVSCLKTAEYVDGILPKIAEDLAHDLANHGCSLDSEKVASFGTPNPNHPVPRAFKKVADFRNERIHVEYALSEIVSQLDRVNQELHALCG